MSKTPVMKPATPKAVQDAQRASNASQQAHADYRDTAAANSHDLSGGLLHGALIGGQTAKSANNAQAKLDEHAAANKVLIDHNKATRANKNK